MSFVIPIYNVSEYIERCIRSIESQKIDCFEIICVDDGSPDDSVHKLELLKEEFNNIKIHRQSNQGVSTSRNIVIKHS